MGAVSDSGQEDADGGSARTPSHAEAQNAALDAVEPERLLEGEDEGTTYLDDALHWTKVYTELLDFKRGLLTVAEQKVTSLDGDAETEVKETDLKVLTAEAARFERRLAFWEARTDQLALRSVTDSE